jgi:transcriptional regulator GlxA family with amidase domain
LSTRTLTVGTVLFERFELLDVFGPLEMFGRLEPSPKLLMLAEAVGPVKSNQGPSCVADTELSGHTPLDILLIPGGMGTRREVQNQGFLESLSARALSSSWVATVCTGSALLAKTGLLDGRRATTNKRAYGWAASQGPAVAWVAKARWVEDGKFFTSSGVTAGMDMALGLIARLKGRDSAIEAANGSEYTWHEDSAWDPFAKLNGLAP